MDCSTNACRDKRIFSTGCSGKQSNILTTKKDKTESEESRKHTSKRLLLRKEGLETVQVRGELSKQQQQHRRPRSEKFRTLASVLRAVFLDKINTDDRNTDGGVQAVLEEAGK